MIAKEKIDIAKEFIDKGLKLQLEGKLDEAKLNYKMSIEMFPTAEAHTYLGWVFSLQKQFELAIKECQKAIELDRSFGNPYNDIGSYLIHLGKLDEAIPWFFKAINSLNYIPRHYPYYNLGRVYERKGEWLKAIEYYKEAFRLNPNYEIANQSQMRLVAMMN